MGEEGEGTYTIPLREETSGRRWTGDPGYRGVEELLESMGNQLGQRGQTE